MNSTLLRTLLLLPLVGFLTGCPPTNKATFINTSATGIRVVIFNAEEQQPLTSLMISGNTKQRATIKDLSSSPGIIKGYDANMAEIFSVTLDPGTVATKITPQGKITLQFDENSLVVR